MDLRPLDSTRPAAARRRDAIDPDSPGRSQGPPPSEHKERIFALEDLHKMGILEDDEFVAEMECVTNPKATSDPVSPKPHRRGLPPMRVLTGRFSGAVSWRIVPARTMAISRKLVSWKSAGAS
jgi:hypothetical protein